MKQLLTLDKDRSMDIFIRALDGSYFDIQNGVPTGINPFQFEQTPQLKDFLVRLIETCVTDKNNSVTAEEKHQINLAVETVLNSEFDKRRISGVLQSLPDTGGNCLFRRLLHWCDTVEYGTGVYAWVLDNPYNQFDPNDFKIVGFDVGAILQENYPPTEPILASLLYLKSEMVKNYDIVATVVEEFWLPLKYKTPIIHADTLAVVGTDNIKEIRTEWGNFPPVISNGKLKELSAENEYQQAKNGNFEQSAILDPLRNNNFMGFFNSKILENIRVCKPRFSISQYIY